LLEVLTIGHSTLSYEEFLRLLREAGATALADVRSSPYSRHFPQFNGATLKNELRLDKVAYVFLGFELGGRPQKPELFCEGVADYEKMAAEENFKAGINRVLLGSSKYRIALMCSEHNPLDCHRCLLVGRALFEAGATVKHILSSGNLISQTEIEQQLMDEYAHRDDMFDKGRDEIANAYRKRSRQVSYRATIQNRITAAE
jgi:uncharacterized protein (DUF488 family)